MLNTRSDVGESDMKKKLKAGLGACVAVGTLIAVTPGASAAIPAPVQDWYPSASQSACFGTGMPLDVNWPNSNGSIVPIVIGNYSNQTMTGSYTADISGVQISPSFAAAIGSPACNATLAVGGSANFTVPAYGSTVLWASFYGSNKNQFGQSFSIGFGGAPGGQGGAGWFDLTPNFQGGGSVSNLANITSSYDGTGGTNGSNQNNFNLVACNQNAAAGTVGLTDNILTPYSSGWTNGPTYQPFQPICAAWFPQGTMVTSGLSVTPQQGVTTQAAQVNGGTVSFAGTGFKPGMTISYQNTATSDPAMDPQAVIPLSNVPNNGPFLTVNSAGQWAAVNIPNGGYVNLILGTTLSSPIIAAFNAG